MTSTGCQQASNTSYATDFAFPGWRIEQNNLTREDLYFGKIELLEQEIWFCRVKPISSRTVGNASDYLDDYLDVTRFLRPALNY